MYLILIVIVLFLVWLLLDSFVKSNPKIMARFAKQAKWYALSAFLIILSIWLLFTGKAYLSWVGLFAFLPLMKRLFLGAVTFFASYFIRNKMRNFLGEMNHNPQMHNNAKVSTAKAERLLGIAHDADEEEIIRAYLQAKKQLSKLRKSAPDQYQIEIATLEAARDQLLAHAAHPQN